MIISYEKRLFTKCTLDVVQDYMYEAGCENQIH